MKNAIASGAHYLIEFFDCDFEQIDSMDFWKEILPKSLEGTPMVILDSCYYKFEPHGITGFLLLSASHLSIHTWPENNYVACDVFSCSLEEDTKKIADFLIAKIKHKKANIQKINRGYKVC